MRYFVLPLVEDEITAKELLKKNTSPMISFTRHDVVVKTFLKRCFNFGIVGALKTY